MISHASFQEQVIDELQAFAALTALVPAAEIREFYWQGTEFTYPNVRVDTRPQISEGRGNCRMEHSVMNFAVYFYSEDDSSLECERIGFQVVEALFGQQIQDAAPSQGPAWTSGVIDLVNLGDPRRTGERAWRGEAVFRVRVQE